MDAKTQADIIAAAVKKYGHIHQMMKAVEEMGELQRAIARMIEHNLETKDPEPPELIENLIEETADVWIMVNQMACIMDTGAVKKAKGEKLRRLAERMGMDIEEAAP